MSQSGSNIGSSDRFLSKRDRRLFKAEIKDEEGEYISGEISNLVDVVREVDAPQKALSGRKPEQYAEESGIPLEELFPEGKEILNIGDPWQTLDLEGVTSVDYEFGEEAEFVRDPEFFLNFLSERTRAVTRLG